MRSQRRAERREKGWEVVVVVVAVVVREGNQER